jgi:hypothetical protein
MKKNLGGLDALIGGDTRAAVKDSGNGKAKQGRPKTNFTPDLLPEDEDRASIIVKTATWEKFKALGYWERRKQKTLLDDILTGYLESWEKKHGTIKPIPAGADK